MADRNALIAGVLAIAVLLSGCAATQQEFTFESEPATFSEEAVSEAGYEKVETRRFVVNRTVEAGGTERDVTVINYATGYERQVSVGGGERALAGAVVVTTPSITIVGVQFNPIADESPRDLVGRARSRIRGQLGAGRVSDVSFVENRTATVLGKRTTVGVFSATASVNGSEVELRVLVTKVKHDGDFVLVAAAYPEALAADERPRVGRLFGNVEH